MLIALTFLGCTKTPAPSIPQTDVPARESLRSVESFADMANTTVRSRALFTEMSRVLKHPRCTNCHPSDDRPRQGMAQELHEPPVWRGPDSHGEPAMRCATCHQEENSSFSRIPGAHAWHLAPASMGWIGQSTSHICEQLKDPERNGGKDLEALHEHLAGDPLVAWGWAPGSTRVSAPGSQQELAALTRAWIDTGAHCPTETP